MGRNWHYTSGPEAGEEPLSMAHHSVGVNHVGSYQVAGIPYMTGAADMAATGSEVTAMQHRIEFPSVTKSITVINTSAKELRVHFASAVYNATTLPNGSEHVMKNYHYVPLRTDGATVTMNVKSNEIFITNMGTAGGAYSLYAELTHIPPQRMGTSTDSLSGSGINMQVDGAKSAGDRR
jgi:hypothetical protein